MKYIQFYNLNSHNQEFVRGKYGHITFNDQFIVYDEKDSNDNIIVYGYYSIELLRITDSWLYPYLVSQNDPIDAQKMTDSFNSAPCYCITQMKMDADIDKAILYDVFNFIALYCTKKVRNGTRAFIWKEHKNKILFYPIIKDDASYIGYPSMANYFADNF